MTSLAVYPTCIGWGVHSALGPSARHTGFYLRAGRKSIAPSPFVDDLGDAVTMSFAPSLPRDLTGASRFMALAASAMNEALAPHEQNLAGQRVRVCVGIPGRFGDAGGRTLQPEGQKFLAEFRNRPEL